METKRRIEHSWRDDPRIQKVKGTFESPDGQVPLLVPWEWFDWVLLVPRFIILIVLYTVIMVLQVVMWISGWIRRGVNWLADHPWINLRSAKRVK